MKDLNAERLTLNFSRLRCWDTHRKMFQIVEKWFILSWSHLIVNGHNHFSTIWNVSDCRKMVYIWSHLNGVNGHIHFSTIWNTSIFLQSELKKYFMSHDWKYFKTWKYFITVLMLQKSVTDIRTDRPRLANSRVAVCN